MACHGVIILVHSVNSTNSSCINPYHLCLASFSLVCTSPKRRPISRSTRLVVGISSRALILNVVINGIIVTRIHYGTEFVCRTSSSNLTFLVIVSSSSSTSAPPSTRVEVARSWWVSEAKALSLLEDICLSPWPEVIKLISGEAARDICNIDTKENECSIRVTLRAIFMFPTFVGRFL